MRESFYSRSLLPPCFLLGLPAFFFLFWCSISSVQPFSAILQKETYRFLIIFGAMSGRDAELEKQLILSHVFFLKPVLIFCILQLLLTSVSTMGAFPLLFLWYWTTTPLVGVASPSVGARA